MRAQIEITYITKRVARSVLAQRGQLETRPPTDPYSVLVRDFISDQKSIDYVERLCRRREAARCLETLFHIMAVEVALIMKIKIRACNLSPEVTVREFFIMHALAAAMKISPEWDQGLRIVDAGGQLHPPSDSEWTAETFITWLKRAGVKEAEEAV